MASSATVNIVLSAATLLLSTICLLSRRARSYLSLPPGPPPLPLIGNLHQAPKSYPWLAYHAWSKTYTTTPNTNDKSGGDRPGIIHLSIAGQPVVILSTSKSAHDLLSKRGATFSDRPRSIVAGETALRGYHMLLRPYNERFKLHQKLQAPVLSPRAARAYYPLQELESRQLVWDLLFPADGVDAGYIDPHAPIERAVASAIYTLFYGHRVHSADDKILLEAHAVNHEFDDLAQPGKYLVDAFPWLAGLSGGKFARRFLPGFMTRWKDEAERHWDRQRGLHLGNFQRGSAFESEREDEGLGHWNVSRQMKKAVDEMAGGDMGFRMDDEELALNIGIMADAALDTTTLTLTWFLLAWITSGKGSTPGWVKKAQAELDKVVGRERLPNFEDKEGGQLEFIDAVMEEALRWRPAGPLGFPHFTHVESSYEGYRIPARSVVIYNAWSITHEEGVFGQGYDVDEFAPERFLSKELRESEERKRMPGFGYGRRVCPGRHVARNALWIMIARTLWAFDVTPELDERGHPVEVDLRGSDSLVTKPLPFKCRFRARGQWVEDLVGRECDTWGTDHYEILDKIGLEVGK